MAPKAALSARLTATKRLVADLKEVVDHPLPDIVAFPSEDNLFCWHGNVRSPQADGFLAASRVIHFSLHFDDNYPLSGPECYLLAPLPHLNVERRHMGLDGQWRYRVALWDCTAGENGWSATYSVHTTLMQLQVVLLDEDLIFNKPGLTVQQAVQIHSEIECRSCCHSGHRPKPAFPAESEMAAAADAKRRLVSIPNLSKWQKTCKSHDVAPSSCAVPPAKTLAPQVEGSAPEKDRSTPLTVARCRDAMATHGPMSGSGQMSKHISMASSVPVQVSNYFSALQNLPEAPVSATAKPAVKGAPLQSTATNDVKLGNSESCRSRGTSMKPSKSAKKNAARSRRRAAAQKSSVTTSQELSPHKQDQHQGGHAVDMSLKSGGNTGDAYPLSDSCSSSAVGSASSVPPWGVQHKADSCQRATANPDESGSDDGFKVVGKRRSVAHRVLEAGEELEAAKLLDVPHSTLISNVVQEAKRTRPASSDATRQRNCIDRGSRLPSHWHDGASGPFLGSLSQELLNMVMSQLEPVDVSNLACTCRGLAARLEDGDIWRKLTSRCFPCSRLSPTEDRDWRYIFILEANDAADAQKCFVTKETQDETVLGAGFRFTVNPRTSDIDYVEVDSGYLLSVKGFHSLGVTKSPSNEAIQGVLPLYLTDAHFSRCEPHLNSALRQLCPLKIQPGGAVPSAEWLNVIPKILNTSAVLLADKGIAVSDSCLSTFCGVHRLFLELVDRYRLQAHVDKLIRGFADRPGLRTKAKCPSLGSFINLLSVSASHTWQDVARAYVGECFDRKVLWVCKKDPSLVDRLSQKPSTTEVDEELLDGVWRHSLVSLRLMMFQVGFLRLVARPEGMTAEQMKDTYDLLYGRPGGVVMRRFKAYVKGVLKVNTWPTFFKTIGLQCPSKAYLTGWLRQCWRNSLAKGYHKLGMNFAKVQKSGVSQILLKGEVYTTPSNLGTITMTEHWRWNPENHSDWFYLDVSCLIFDEHTALIDTVDFENMFSNCHVQHSGDDVDGFKCKGTHILTIRSRQVPQHVHSMVITLSGWVATPLSRFKQVFIEMKDSETGVDLCKYQLDHENKAELARNTAVVMCRIQRGAGGHWEVEAVGKLLPSGSAGNYSPIVEYVQSTWGAEEA